MPDAARRLFWSRTKRLTAVLLLAWLLINLIVPWFARDLDGLRAFNFPAGYWLAAEGALLLYLLIVVIYVWAMERLDAQYLRRIQDDAADPPAAGPM